VPVTRLLLVRHGETDWNREARIQGQLDVPLNGIGREQARRLAERLAGEGIQAVYSSDLDRACETARIALPGPGMEARRMPELREAAFGVWQGRRWADLEREAPREVLRYRGENGDYAPPGGESPIDLRARSVAAFARILDEEEGRTVAVFSHGGPCRMILADLLGVAMPRVRRLAMSNASVHSVKVEGDDAQVVLLNDTAHLTGECAPLSVFQARTSDG
jgi:2,3-bisphosphoglycerate-dependent phosphoglycerate mutase